MENLHRLKTEALVDILSTQTDVYIRMQHEGSTEKEFAQCKLLLRAIQNEINLREKRDSTINHSNEEILAE